MLVATVGVTFLILTILSLPIVFSLGIAGFAGLLAGNFSLQKLPSSLVTGSQSWVLLAIPTFVFAGSLMERCGMSYALVDLARALVGWVRGGLGVSEVLAEYFFSGISGSTVADALVKAQPGEWQALRTRDGWRAMRLNSLTAPKPAVFQSLRGVVLQDWTDAVMAEQRSAAVRALARKYRVKIESVTR